MTDQDHAFTEHRWRLPFGEPVDLAAWPTSPPADAGDPGRWDADRQHETKRLARHQEVLFAHDTHALLCVLQGMDSAGKDSAIRKVLSGVNPAGCDVHAFGRPSADELEHDFLWRVHARVPRRGRVAVFNRSHYEDVVTVRVHPELLEAAGLRSRRHLDSLWEKRFSAIRAFEHHLADSGIVVVKVFLHLARDEQRKRLLARLDKPHKRWKADPSDVRARAHWDAYQAAWADAIARTHRPWAPWYVIPADDKPYARLQLARLLADTLDRLDLRRPAESEARVAALEAMREALQGED